MTDVEVSSSDTTHVFEHGVVDPTTDRDPSHWVIEREPPPDLDTLIFMNEHIGYVSYDPPKGFTAEDLIKFNGAEESRFFLEEAKALIAKRDKHGTLVISGDARWG